MGRYLRTGIITEFSASVKSVDDLKANSETSIEQFVNALVDNPNSFNLSKTEEEYVWTLKPEIVEKDLMPFLEQYYKDIYQTEYTKDRQEILTFIKGKPTLSMITDFANKSVSPVFREGWGSKEDVNVGSESILFGRYMILLSEEGKIVYEFIYGHLNFFKRSIRKIYQQSPLGGGLIVNVY